MWDYYDTKDEIKKQRSDEQQIRMDALDFAEEVLDIIKIKLSSRVISPPPKSTDYVTEMLSKSSLEEVRQSLRELYLEAVNSKFWDE